MQQQQDDTILVIVVGFFLTVCLIILVASNTAFSDPYTNLTAFNTMCGFVTLFLSGVIVYLLTNKPKPEIPKESIIEPEPIHRTYEPEPAQQLPDPTQFFLKLGQPQKWEANKARVLMEGLINLAQGAEIALEFLATENTLYIGVRYGASFVTAEAFSSTIQSSYPDMEVEEEGEWPGFGLALPFIEAYHVFARSRNHPFFETMTGTGFSQDPLALLTLALDKVQSEELLVFNLIVREAMTFSEEQREDLLKMSRWEAGERPRLHYQKDFVRQGINTYYETARLHSSLLARYKAGDERRFEQKLSQTNYLINLALYFETQNEKRLQWFDTLVAQAKGLATSHPMIAEGSAGKETIRAYLPYRKNYPGLIIDQWTTNQNNRHLFAVTIDELAALWHIPHEGFTAKSLQWKVHAPLPDELKGIKGVLVGHSGRDAVRFPTSLKFRTEHMAILGRPGMGKSSMMQTQIGDDIKRGRGVIVIDPKGDLVRDVLRYSVIPKREDDVVVLDIFEKIGDDRYPPPLNPLSGNPDDLTAILDSLFKSSWSDTRASDWVSLALHTLNFFEGATIRDIKRVIQDANFRETLLSKGIDSANPEIRLAIQGLRDAWKSYDATVEKQSSIDAINRRLDTFTTDGQLLALTCNPQPLQLAEWIEKKKIILIALGRDFEGQKRYGKALKQQELQILGTSLVSQIFRLAMAGRIPKKNRPYTLYVDEAHLFKTAPIDEMLALVRGRGLGLVLSTQSLNQLVEGMQDTFEDCVSTIISFQVSRTNAQKLATYMSPSFTDGELTKLNRYQAAVYMKDEHGTQHQAFQLNTLPPPGVEPEPVLSDKKKVAQQKQQLTKRRKEAIETELRIRQKSATNLGLKTYRQVADLILNDQATGGPPSLTVKKYGEDDEKEFFPDGGEPTNDSGE